MVDGRFVQLIKVNELFQSICNEQEDTKTCHKFRETTTLIYSETGQTTCGSGGPHPNSTTILKNLTLEVRANLR